MASKLILKFKESVISECPLEQEETTIGRKPDNTVHIDNLAVSGRHARVLKIGNKAILEDLGSTNGTHVNNKRVTKHVLKHGDVILIGKHTLTYVEFPDEPAIPVPSEQDDDSIDKTTIITPQARAAMAMREGTTSSTTPIMPLGGVQVISGPQAGRSFELSSSLTSVGKGDTCKIKVKGFTVGKQAAVITRRPTGYHIAYLEGMAKTKINGEAIGSDPYTLNDGDIIEIGDTRMEFFIKE